MFVNNVIKDSFRELPIVLKNVKLAVFSLPVIIFSLILMRFQENSLILVCTFPLLITTACLLLNVYQYITIPILISTKEKDMIKFFGMENISYKTALVRLIKSILLLTILAIGAIISAIITVIITGEILISSGIILKIALSIIGITIYSFFIIVVIRLFLLVPLIVLFDLTKPITYCWELSKGRFWKLALIILSSIIIMLPNFFLDRVLKASPFILLIIATILNFIILNMTALIFTNSLYYSMNENLLSSIEEFSSFENI